MAVYDGSDLAAVTVYKKGASVVRLIDTSLCKSCRFAAVIRVQTNTGEVVPVLHCKRLDCDNWQREPITEE